MTKELLHTIPSISDPSQRECRVWITMRFRSEHHTVGLITLPTSKRLIRKEVRLDWWAAGPRIPIHHFLRGDSIPRTSPYPRGIPVLRLPNRSFEIAPTDRQSYSSSDWSITFKCFVSVLHLGLFNCPVRRVLSSRTGHTAFDLLSFLVS